MRLPVVLFALTDFGACPQIERCRRVREGIWSRSRGGGDRGLAGMGLVSGGVRNTRALFQLGFQRISRSFFLSCCISKAVFLVIPVIGVIENR